LLKLPPHLESFPSKRRKFIKRSAHTSTYQNCGHTSMSTELIQKDIGSPSTPIPTIVNDTPSTPSTTMVVVPEVPIITPIRPIVNTQPIVTNPFGSLCHSSGYNTQSIPTASIPFPYGMSNFTSQFSSSIPVSNTNTSIVLGGMSHSHIPFSFSGSHIPQTTPMVGSLPPFHPWSNPGLNAPGWSGQLEEKYVAYVPSFTPTSSTPILTNMFGMTDPFLSFRFTPRGGQFHTLGNPHPGATSVGGNIYNPHHNIPTRMVPNQPLVNQFGGGFIQSRIGPWCI
jgi:hypothetical protein